MHIYPLIQLLDGHVVSLNRTNRDDPTYWGGDPVEKALGFVEQGAEWLQLTDLDALHGVGDNAAIIEQIIRRAGVPVQVGGGLRGTEQVERWIEAGAARVILGTNAVRFPDWAKELAKKHPDQIAVSVDVWEGRVMVEGWTEQAMFGPMEVAQAFETTPLAAMILTDIDRHLEYPDASFALTTKFAEATKLPVIAAGVVRNLDDVSSLRYLPNIEGAVIGRALLDRSVDLGEALAIARPAPEQVARFK